MGFNDIAMDAQTLLQNILWDYKIPASECYEVLMGKKRNAGHYDQYSIFRKLMESYPWFIIMEILPMNRIKELLTLEVITLLRSKQLQKRYEYIRDKLSHFV